MSALPAAYPVPRRFFFCQWLAAEFSRQELKDGGDLLSCAVGAARQRGPDANAHKARRSVNGTGIGQRTITKENPPTRTAGFGCGCATEQATSPRRPSRRPPALRLGDPGVDSAKMNARPHHRRGQPHPRRGGRSARVASATSSSLRPGTPSRISVRPGTRRCITE